MDLWISSENSFNLEKGLTFLLESELLGRSLIALRLMKFDSNLVRNSSRRCFDDEWDRPVDLIFLNY